MLNKILTLEISELGFENIFYRGAKGWGTRLIKKARNVGLKISPDAWDKKVKVLSKMLIKRSSDSLSQEDLAGRIVSID